MHDSQTVADASPLIKRQSRREWQYTHTIKAIVRDATSVADLQHRLKTELYSDEGFTSLPKFRILVLDGFLRGCLEMAATMEGRDAPAISLEVPRTRVEDRRKNLSQKIESLKTHSVPTSPKHAAPAWLSETPTIGRAILDKMIEAADRQESGVVERPVVEVRRRPVSEIQSTKPDARAGTLPPPAAQSEAPPAHRVVGGARRTFRRRRLR